VYWPYCLFNICFFPMHLCTTSLVICVCKLAHMFVKENSLDGAVDTRMRLLMLHRGEKVPYSEMISTRAVALKQSLSALWQDAQQASLAQYMGWLWFVWFLICSIEEYRPSDKNSNIFSTLFEVYECTPLPPHTPYCKTYPPPPTHTHTYTKLLLLIHFS
jgi:hypothetical protein